MATPTPVARYERGTASDGRQYLLCANCRRPLLPGKAYNPCHPIPIPGHASPDATKQATCGPCYLQTWRTIYPLELEPTGIEDGYVVDEQPIPWGRKSAEEPGALDDVAQYRAAMEASIASNGGETVAQAHARLYGEKGKPDVTMSGVTEDIPGPVPDGGPHECDDGPNPLDPPTMLQ